MKRALLVIALLGATLPAHATLLFSKPMDGQSGQTVLSETPALAPQGLRPLNAASKGGVRTVIVNRGTRPATLQASPVPAGSTLTGMSMEDALGQIIPTDYRVMVADGVDLSVPATVRISGTWLATLSQMLVGTNYSAAVDWGAKTVAIVIDTGWVKSSSAAKPAPGAKSGKKWSILKSDGMMSDAVARWCRESGGECVLVKLVTKKDVPLEAGGDFYGTLDEALKTLFQSLSESTGHKFVHKIHENKVVVISDGK